MEYFAVLIIIAVMLAPVLWIMPSPRQKHQAVLRQEAIKLGLQVNIVNLPQTRRQRVRQQATVKGAVYRMPWLQPDKSAAAFSYLCLRETDNDIEEKERETKLTILLMSELLSLPDDVVAIEYSNLGLAVYWREKGNLQQINTIFNQLVKLKEIINKTNC